MDTNFVGNNFEVLKKVLVENKYLFAWIVADMLGIDPRIISYKLSIVEMSNQ